MKVTTYVPRDLEVKVDVSIEHVVASLPRPIDDTSTFRLFDGLNLCAEYMRAVPAEFIAGLTPKGRQVMVEFLRAQLARYEAQSSPEARPASSSNEADRPSTSPAETAGLSARAGAAAAQT